MNEVASRYVRDVKRMAESVYHHPALDNKFYDVWMERPLSPPQLEVFATNYYHWIAPTVRRLGLAFLSLGDDLTCRFELIHNMFDEHGNGQRDKIHVLLLKRWLDALLQKTCGHPFKDTDAASAALLPSTQRLTDESMKLCSGPAPLASGAVLAQEWHAYTQFVKLYEGYRHYMKSFDLDEFHDSCEYLYIHIGWAEKEHKEQTIVLATRTCNTAADLELLKKGFTGFLDLLGDFWNGIYDSISSMEKIPVTTAARQRAAPASHARA